MHAVGFIVAALTLLNSALVKDETWTTTGGVTYHHVYEVSRNTLEVDITCDKGKVTVQLADLPTAIQVRFGYDAKKEAAMNAYLDRLTNASAAAAIHAYGRQVLQLDTDPGVLRQLSASDLVWLQQNRLIGGGYIAYKLPKDEADALVRNEVPLVGHLVMAIESKSNPDVDMKTPMSINDLPIEFVVPNATPEQRAAYKAQCAANQKQRALMNAEFQVRRDIWFSIVEGKRYLRVLYHHELDGASIEPEVWPLMTEAGIDPATIDFLLGKTTYKEM